MLDKENYQSRYASYKAIQFIGDYMVFQDVPQNIISKWESIPGGIKLPNGDEARKNDWILLSPSGEYFSISNKIFNRFFTEIPDDKQVTSKL